MEQEAREGAGIEGIHEAWSEASFARLVRARIDMPGRDPLVAPPPGGLGPAALAGAGVQALFAHQAEAIRIALGGRNVVVATPTASGKSLCYQIPILEMLGRSPSATAILVFPTKALGRDQVRELGAMADRAGIRAEVAAYDGDTPQDARRLARARARILFTNPDMIHMGILPHHTMWASFLAGLSAVVIDELHEYRGVFGSHFANVIRRLKRVLRFHGARPVWLASSATIRNPADMASTLAGEPFSLVSSSGAPSGRRTLYIMTPPLVDPASGMRGSYLHLAARVASDLVRAGLQTLVFAGSRRAVEMLVRYVRDRVRRGSIEPEVVQGYRGGYLPALRRRIEDGLKGGQLRCVVATSALELGVDIGSLDAVVLAGYPGSVASAWQRIGRAGRRLGPSVAALVCSASPLDQFVADHPEYLASTPPERGLLNPDNLDIVLEHMKCAAFELPFEEGECFGSLDAAETREIMDHLAGRGLVHASGGRYVWVADEFPGAGVGLRSIGPEPFVVSDGVISQVIGEVDGASALRMLHEEAIYQHAGLPYLVEKLDLGARRAVVREVEPEYYTEPVVASTMTPMEVERSVRLGQIDARFGEVRIIEKVTGFRKIRFGTHENLGTGEVDLPETSMEAFAVWLAPTAEGMEVIAATEPEPGIDARAWTAEGMSGLGHIMAHIAAIRLMCDPHDLVPVVGLDPESEGGIALYIHEAQPGGVGLADKLHDQIEDAAADALDALRRCPCRSGCPSCAGPAARTGVDRKAAARALLMLMVSHDG